MVAEAPRKCWCLGRLTLCARISARLHTSSRPSIQVAKPLCLEVFGGAGSLITSVFCQSMQKHLAYSWLPNIQNHTQYLPLLRSCSISHFLTPLHFPGTTLNKLAAHTQINPPRTHELTHSHRSLQCLSPPKTQQQKFPRNALVISTSCSSPYKTRASKP